MKLARAIPSARADFKAATQYLSRWPEWPGEDIASMQLRKLSAIWADAIEDVPYYRNMVAEGRAPSQIGSWLDFAAIPVLDRATFREHEANFVRLSGPPNAFMQTAGSTGNPIRFGVWQDEGRPQRIVKQATWIKCGYELGSEILLIWGHSHLLGTGWRRWVNHAKRLAKDNLLGYHRANAYTLGKEDCMQIARWIVRARPVGIIGYAAALDLLARHAAELRDDLRKAGVRFVITTAEAPPRQDTLALLRDLFGGATIIEEFGGVEFGQVAVRFNEEDWVTYPDLNILEAAKTRDDPEGHSLVLTTLYRRYTPFIRYKQGDLIAGVQWLEQGQVIGFDELVGRAADMVVMPDGRSVHSVAFFHCIHQEPAVLNIQMILTDQGPQLKLVTRSRTDDSFDARIRHRLKQIHASLETAPLEYVQDLATNAAGKRRWFLDRRTR